jgi:ribosomal subunit interface protein
MSLRIHFRDVPHSDEIRRECEQWVDALGKEFPETSKYEVTVSHSKGEHETHVHVTGKDLELASVAQKRDLKDALTEGFERVRRQLRKHHDKKIYARRRSAKGRNSEGRNSG